MREPPVQFSHQRVNGDSQFTHAMFSITPQLWALRYPLKHAGLDLQRNVTVVRLESGRVAILSSGPFTPDEVAAIKDIGQPCWLVEAMLRHDTFSREGWAA